ncbi:MAG: hypothetical protein EKK63_12705 [Acinetobacter sp.]|uniref:hypothetical protein n=1 Tax=Acinetobacter sp. TaxID=472 RepID=UPI000FBF9F43|nr:hypothetical protein [Acinetobacter sp.]RUP38234.1 MAG: hypothetical protein EKK63_12705 [Acinetobacter sp.]
MKVYSIQQFKDEFARLGYVWDMSLNGNPFAIIGVRSQMSVPDKFDDALFVVINGTVYAFPCTTNPGKDYLLAPLNPKGTANVKPGQYRYAYVFGLHKGLPALIQTGAPITVYRDADKDQIAEETAATETGFFGINIHRANNTATSYLIGRWSAGCQVVANPDDYEMFLALCHTSGLSKFTYTLLKEF